MLLPPANEVWGKVIFLHLFVILFTGGFLFWGGVCSRGGSYSWGGCLLWGVPAPGGTNSWGVSAPRGMSAPGGCLLLGGACSRGVPGGDPPGTATAAGGTHPTGMHSCSKYKKCHLFKCMLHNSIV